MRAGWLVFSYSKKKYRPSCSEAMAAETGVSFCIKKISFFSLFFPQFRVLVKNIKTIIFLDGKAIFPGKKSAGSWSTLLDPNSGIQQP